MQDGCLTSVAVDHVEEVVSKFRSVFREHVDKSVLLSCVALAEWWLVIYVAYPVPHAHPKHNSSTWSRWAGRREGLGKVPRRVARCQHTTSVYIQYMPLFWVYFLNLILSKNWLWIYLIIKFISQYFGKQTGSHCGCHLLWYILTWHYILTITFVLGH